MFTLALRGLVYPQIWEDPEVDLKALELKPGARMVAIALVEPAGGRLMVVDFGEQQGAPRLVPARAAGAAGEIPRRAAR